MKNLTIILLIIISGHVFADLPVLVTRFRKMPFEQVMQYAQQDNAEAQFELAQRHYAGYQTPRNMQEAFSWMRRSAELANPDAQLLLSCMYAEGVGTVQDADKEEHYFSLALAAQPDSRSLQDRYVTYLEQKKNTPEAKQKFITRCAEAGYFPANAAIQYPVATNLYAKGKYDEAMPVFRQLAEKGDPASACYLAKMYSKGLGGLLEDNIEAFGLYEHAASNNYAEAQYELAVMYEEGRGILEDEDLSVLWFEKAARNGHANAQFRFADFELRKAIFWQEQGEEDESSEEQRNKDHSRYSQYISSAAIWYKKAADQGHANAQYMIGRCYASGEGVAQNFAEAVRFYELAGTQGHAEAEFYLGLMYQAGLGVAQDTSKAIRLYEKAASKGQSGALYYLGNCYRFGVGVARDVLKGEKYYKEALTEARLSKPSSVTILKNGWLADAAREYGVILWQKADSSKGFEDAKKWIGMAAQNGDVKAQDILLKMNIKDRRNYSLDTDLVRPEILENQIDARVDAVRQKRVKNFLPLYLSVDLKVVYPKSDAARNIAYVQIHNKRHTNVAGEGLWELQIKYRRPATRNAVDFNGVLLICVDFTDRKTGNKFWGFCKSDQDSTVSDSDPMREVSVYMNMNPYPDAQLTGWAVVYGHLLEDGTVFAVFDSEEKSHKTPISTIFQRNAGSSRQIETIAVKTVDLSELTNK